MIYCRALASPRLVLSVATQAQLIDDSHLVEAVRYCPGGLSAALATGTLNVVCASSNCKSRARCKVDCFATPLSSKCGLGILRYALTTSGVRLLLRAHRLRRPNGVCEAIAVHLDGHSARTVTIPSSSSNVEYRCARLTNRSSGRVRDKVPSSYAGARAAQLNR